MMNAKRKQYLLDLFKKLDPDVVEVEEFAVGKDWRKNRQLGCSNQKLYSDENTENKNNIEKKDEDI